MSVRKREVQGGEQREEGREDSKKAPLGRPLTLSLDVSDLRTFRADHTKTEVRGKNNKVICIASMKCMVSEAGIGEHYFSTISRKVGRAGSEDKYIK